MLPPHAETNGTTITSEKIDLCMMLLSLLDAPLSSFRAATLSRHESWNPFLQILATSAQRGRNTPARIESADCVLGQKCVGATPD